MKEEKYMRRCIELAKNGLGATYPNPMVGAVIVHNDQIIGEGWHQKAGQPHAEVNAVAAVKDQSLLSQSTLYVSLEPCSHFGKTPPCCNLIIDKNIPNVVVGTIDPNSKVAGSGIAKLKAAGKNVTVGLLEKECQELNKRFFTFHTKKRPYIILKWAESSDGFIAPKSKDVKAPVWISNALSRQLVHKWRSEEQAILVGTKTVLDDNPKLDTRNWNGKNPIRIVLDKSGKIPKESHVFDGKTKTIIITEQENLTLFSNCIFENAIFEVSLPQKIMAILYKHEIQSLIVEGGSQTLQSFIDANLWDEIRLFRSNAVMLDGVKAPRIAIKKAIHQTLLDDEFVTFFNDDKYNNL